jgi:hypothetical protein
MRQATTTRKHASRPWKRSLLKAKAARQANRSWQTRMPIVCTALFTK